MVSGRQTLRAGVIGAGSWARVAHLPALLSHPDTEVVAVCDADPAALDAVTALLPDGCARYGDAKAMLAQEALDLVCIVTPDDQHVAPIRAAVANRTHIVCEKPLALTGAEAWELTQTGGGCRTGQSGWVYGALLAGHDRDAHPDRFGIDR